MNRFEGIRVMITADETDFSNDRIPDPGIFCGLREKGVSAVLVAVSVLPFRPPEERAETIKRLRNKIETGLAAAGFCAFVYDPPGQPKMIGAVNKNKNHPDMPELSFVIGYDGRTELAHILEKLIGERKTMQCTGNDGAESGTVTEADIEKHLPIPFTPDLVIGNTPDLSEMMIWQTTYSELYFSGKTYRETEAEDLVKAVSAYESRKRRYGH